MSRFRAYVQKRQDVLDETEKLNRDKLRYEVEGQTPSEVKERARESLVEGGGTPPSAEGNGSTAVAGSVNHVLEIESRIFAILNETLVPGYVGQPNAKLRTAYGQLFLDAVFRTLRHDRADIIVEIKYLTRPTGILMRLRDTVVRVAHACSVYRKAFDTPVIGLVIMVFAQSVTSPMNEATARKRFDEAAASLESDLALLLIREEELMVPGGATLRSKLMANPAMTSRVR